MTAARTDSFLGARYRRHARRRGKQKAIVAGSRTIIEIAWRIIADPGFRYIELGPDYHDQLDPGAQDPRQDPPARKTQPRHDRHPDTPPGTRRAPAA